jgi:hypothetical protein
MAIRTSFGLRSALTTSLAFAASGCVSTRLDLPHDHPANPAASTAPLTLSKSLAASPREPAGGVAAAEGPATAASQHVHPEPAAPASSAGGSSSAATTPAPKAPGRASSSQSPAADVWTCPMHPDVLRDGPGKCPICGMNLVKRAKSPQQVERH